jgi:TonB dependent receptor
VKSLVALCVLAGTAYADTALHGIVIDHATKQPIGGAVIRVAGELVASADDGSFDVVIRDGAYEVVVTADWLEPAHQHVELHGAPVAITIEVTARAETIEVTDVAPSAIGEVTVDPKFARSVPGGGDAAKIVQSLPAVARPAAGSTEIVVWGAAPNETRIFVDGVPVPALYHVGGYRSAVGNDLIGDIHLAPAAFGVDRGGALGGVIDIGFADPAKAPDWRVQADVLDGSVEGKTKLGDLTIAGAVRQSWLAQTIGVIEDPHTLAPNAPLPRWTDAQVVARAPLADDLVLSAWAIGSLDTLDRTLASTDPATQTSEDTDQRMARAQVGLRHDRADGYDQASVWAGRDYASEDLAVGTITATQASDAWVGGARAVQTHRLEHGLGLAIGADLDGEAATLHRRGSLTIPAREGDLQIFGQPPGDDVAADAWHASTVDAAGYAALDATLGRFTANLGARADAWLLTASRLTPRIGSIVNVASQQTLFTQDPRGSLRVRVTDDLDLRADGGLYHQARAASDTSAVFGTPDLGLEQAWHAIAGGQWRHAPFAIEAAGYARWLDDLVARDLAVTPMLAHALTQDGIGNVYGLQLTARVIGWNGLSGWVSYNLSRSRRKDADDQPWRYFDHDQTHGLIAVAGWEHGAWTLGGRIRFATGEPRTAVIGAFFDSASGRYEPIRGDHNGERLPAFFAADVRAERRLPLGSIHGAVYLEIQNLTNRANAEELIYSADFTTQGYLTSLPFLAIVGVRIEP